MGEDSKAADTDTPEKVEECDSAVQTSTAHLTVDDQADSELKQTTETMEHSGQS